MWSAIPTEALVEGYMGAIQTEMAKEGLGKAFQARENHGKVPDAEERLFPHLTRKVSEAWRSWSFHTSWVAEPRLKSIYLTPKPVCLGIWYLAKARLGSLAISRKKRGAVERLGKGFTWRKQCFRKMNLVATCRPGLAKQEAGHKWFATHCCGAELLIQTSPIIILIRVVFFEADLCPLVCKLDEDTDRVSLIHCFGLGAHTLPGAVANAQ